MSDDAAFEGTLGFLSLARIIKDLFQRHATGELVLTREEAVKRIFFRNGVIIYAASSQEEDRLGDVLLRHGLISRAQLDESGRQMEATGKKQGTLLVQMGAVSPKDLFRGLNLQVRTIVLSLFDWAAGTYSFSDVLPPREEIVTLRILPAPLIVEGVLGKAAEEEAFRTLWSPETSTLHMQSDPPWPLEDLRIPPVARKLLDCVRRGVPFGEIHAQAGLQEGETRAFLYALRVLEFISAGEEAGPPTEERPPPPPEEVLPSPEKIDAVYDKLRSLNLYQILRLEPKASGEAVKGSYLALAKEYHPDRFFDSRYEDYRDKITAIFMKINEAYNVLSSSERRSEYDRREIHLQVPREERGGAERDSRVAHQQFRKGMETLKAGDTWSAIESFRWAVQLNPRNALYHSWLGAALASTRKRLHEAEEHCKTAIALDYSNPVFYLHLGRVYKTGKLHEKARQQFETALKLDPNFRQAKEELAQLGPGRSDKGFMDRLRGK